MAIRRHPSHSRIASDRPLIGGMRAAAVKRTVACAAHAAIERLEERTLFSAPTQFSSVGVGGGGALFAPSFSPSNPNEVFVSTDMGELFHSTDLGHSWSFPDFRQIQANRASQVQFTNDPNVRYALDYTDSAGGGTQVRPSKTVDSGLHWTPLASWTSQVGNDAYSLYADPHNAARLIATDYNTLYFSGDGGATWTAKYTANNGGAGAFIAGVFWSSDEQHIYIGTNAGSGLLASSDGGQSFALASLTGIGAGESVVSFAGAEQGGVARLYAVTWSSADVFPGMDVEGSPLASKTSTASTRGRAAGRPATAALAATTPFTSPPRRATSVRSTSAARTGRPPTRRSRNRPAAGHNGRTC